jgi:hypothetical protein
MRIAGFVCILFGSAITARAELPPVDFAREVRPILADFCVRCHGPDAKQRQADLRLDVRDEATRESKSKHTPISPGKPDASELVRRVFADDDDVMPPRETGQSLTAAQKETLRRWIAEGAKYQTHWAFVAPRRPAVPGIHDLKSEISDLKSQISDFTLRTRNPIDRFILARIAAAGLQPSPEANRVTLLRRVSLDLTGLPPSIDDVDDFLADHEPDAFERVVDRLLASPRYGEHQARDWLDQARYADTHGYFTDHERFMWRWRDWVIHAFNTDMPFDQFTIEQLAGDLLPNATIEQRIATGFNRNHMITEETGVIPEEYRVEYVADRVRTTSAVWMGLTAGCAQCHDHKYDPLTQREFYQLFAYFNQLPEKGIDGGKQKNAAPELRLPTAEQAAQQERLQQRLRDVQEKLAALSKEAADAKKPLDDELKQLRESETSLLTAIPTLMVMQDQPEPRDTFILERGQYDQPREKVSPGVPAFLPALPNDAPPTRLAFARWLVDPRHPLTARVAVNRHWRQLFGRGLVPTTEDFGVQGELPSHPELLDWLAVEFRKDERRETRDESEGRLRDSRLSTLKSRLAWSVKRLQRLIVTSATYRQSSAITAEHRRVDPQNRLLARAPRYRLDAETLRDSALFASGLLAERLGGPSVKPYQPADLWKSITYDTKSTQEYVFSTGDGLYRRGFYTYWKRQVPPPTMWQLDAPTRETCTLRRQRTNTPLQAFVLLNDTQFVEAARVLAERVLSSAPVSDRAGITLAFRRAVARQPTDAEAESLLRLLSAERLRFQQDRPAAEALLSVGEHPVPSDLNRSELAAWTVLGNVLLNLDEALSRE